MGKYCGQCALLDKNNKRSYYDEYYCIEKCEYHGLADRKADRCNSFLYDPECGKSNKSSFKPSGLFYIITKVNELLGLGNDDEMMRVYYEAGEKLKNSDNIIKDILFEEYDLTGKEIANILGKIPEGKEIAEDIYNMYLNRGVGLLKKGNEKEALIDYLRMVEYYKNYFNIEGLVDINYLQSSIVYNNDLLLTTINDVFLKREIIEFTKTKEYFDKSNEYVAHLYGEVSTIFADITYSIEDEQERYEFVKKYFYTYLDVLSTDIYKFGNDKDIDELVITDLKHMLFSLQNENITKVINKENIQRKRINKISAR